MLSMSISTINKLFSFVWYGFEETATRSEMTVLPNVIVISAKKEKSFLDMIMRNGILPS